jgi:hypothetical protein
MTLEQINEKLKNEYGFFQASEKPNWQLVWSEDEMEKRYGTFEDRTPEGYLIRKVKEVREVYKYRQWLRNKYILERILPNLGNPELLEKTSYEPVYVFENPFNAPPSWDAIKFGVEQTYRNAARVMGVKYKEEDYKAEDKKRIDKIVEELYGDRTDVSDALAYREGIVVPNNYGVVK